MPTAPSAAPSPRASSPRNHRELAEAIFAECDPVRMGLDLLQSGTERGASVRARMFEMLANWQFGQPAAAGEPEASASSGEETGMRVIWDMPRPPHEKHDLGDDEE